MIHPTAIVSPKAALDPSVEVGPYAVIGAGVAIGPGTTVGPHAVLSGDIRIGAKNQIGAGCIIGADSQIKAAHTAGGLTIGDSNVIREYVTIHLSGTQGASTAIGDANYLMAGVHVAHDCRLGSHVVIANSTQLAGHVEVNDHVFISGLVGIHQFVRVGEYAMVGGLTKLVTDVIPFALCDGNPARVRGVNSVGLRRAKFTPDRVRLVKQAVQILYFSGLIRPEAIKAAAPLAERSPEVKRILEFVSVSKRGIAPRAMDPSDDR